MSALPILPETAPFPSEHIQALNQVMAQTSAEQRQWLSGFLAGYQAASSPAAAATAAPAAAARPKIPLTILFATESGNAEGVADDARRLAAKQGFAARVVDMAEARPAGLAGVQNLLVVASTWGEGDPPERAADFYAALMAEDAPRLEGVRFSVLALGDSSYVNFCETGRRLDARLEALGGERLAPRIECDLDFEDKASAWSQETLGELVRIAAPEPAAAGVRGDVIHVDFATAPAASTWSKANPFPAEISELVDLNGSRSAKETLHLELDLEGSGLTFEPGDSLGIVAENDPAMVEAVLRAAGVDGDAAAGERPAAEVLRTDYDITALTRPVVEAYARLSEDAKLAALLEGGEVQGFIEGRQIVDLLEAYPHALTAPQLTGILRRLPPRLYSVASSLKAHPDEAHLLVGVVRYRSHGRARKGVASTFVADRLKVGERLKVYVKPNRYFRLPADAERPVIMIGPGTGVAPFRAFLQEREAAGARGANWLVFGDRTYTHDFLYQLDWQEMHKAGVLTRIDLAFSRDQPEKVYVQHRLWEQRRDLYAWLEEGAHVYVCGDEKRMAKDVDAMLKAIVADQGEGGAEAAAAYIDGLKRAGRYQRDVY